ncbi:MAG: hypothetical protein ACK5M3_14170 [Dysgonomonas sp.]
MKKILMMMVLLVACFGNLFSQSYSHLGPTGNLPVNSVSAHYSTIIGGEQTGWVFTWEVKGGHFSDANGTSDKGLMLDDRYTKASQVYVKWTKEGKGSLVVNIHYLGRIVVTNSWSVNITKDNIPNPDPTVPRISTPDRRMTMYSGESKIFYYERPNDLSATWSIDKAVFEIETQNNRYIVLKAKDISGIKNSQIRAQQDATYGASATITVISTPKISASTSVVCPNNTVVYKVENANMYTGLTYNWQPVSNMTLVSGQGTATATFKASGNDYGKIKLKTSYNGVDCTVENSNVWVGKPSVQILPPSSSGWYEQNSSYIFSAKIDGANTSNTVWKVTGDAKPINQYGKIMTGYTGKKEGVFNITCTTSNVCGTTNSITYTGRNNPTSGTGIPGEGIGLD